MAFSLGIRMVAVSVIFTEEKDWHGKTVTDGTPDHWKDQIVLRMAGKAAEEVFNCPADPTASFHDMLEVDSLLNRKGISEEREARIEEGKTRAAIILEGHRQHALKLIAHLVEHGHVKEAEFLRLMYSEA